MQPGESLTELYWLRLDVHPPVELCEDCVLADGMTSHQVREAVMKHLQAMRAAKADSLPKDMVLPDDPRLYVCSNQSAKTAFDVLLLFLPSSSS